MAEVVLPNGHYSPVFPGWKPPSKEPGQFFCWYGPHGPEAIRMANIVSITPQMHPLTTQNGQLHPRGGQSTGMMIVGFEAGGFVQMAVPLDECGRLLRMMGWEMPGGERERA